MLSMPNELAGLTYSAVVKECVHITVGPYNVSQGNRADIRPENTLLVRYSTRSS